MPVQAISATPKRLRILGEEEIEALYGQPRFTPEARQEYFTFSPPEKAALEQFHSLPSRLYCMLQLGYFKARQLFFTFSLREVEADIRYLQEHYFPARFRATEITKVTRLKQQRVILALCHSRHCDVAARHQLAVKAQQAARVCAKPVYVFRELWHSLTTQRLVAPGYTVLQELIGKALTAEQQRLVTVVRAHLEPADIGAFQRLLFETRLSTINARHSPKYFGLKKGVVAYTMVANHVPVNAQIIGANEHESHYVFDLLFNNTTEIQPDIHSTDTHGTNEVNFALLHVFGYQFAPRYRDIQTKMQEVLYGFQHPTQYGAVLLKPIRKLNTRLIVEEWENLQRIFVSLALKTTTQHIIVGKLSAYARKNKTRRALWEYDNIIRSLYLLDYVDSPPLRRNVQRALNRGENYHQLRHAVSYANFGKLRFKTEYEQQLWEECSRLITNCIIYYNATILSQLHAHKERLADATGATLLTQVSPVAWQHINLCGRYEFTKGPAVIHLPAIIQALAQAPVTQNLAR